MCVGLCACGYCSVYVVWMSMCFGSFRCRLRVMGGVLPSNLVRATGSVNGLWFINERQGSFVGD